MKHLIVPIIAIVALSFTSPKPNQFETDFFSYVDAVENYNEVKDAGGNITAAGDLVWEKAQVIQSYPDAAQKFAEIVGVDQNVLNCKLGCFYAQIGCLRARINVDMCNALVRGCVRACEVQYSNH